VNRGKREKEQGVSTESKKEPFASCGKKKKDYIDLRLYEKKKKISRRKLGGGEETNIHNFWGVEKN